MPWAKAPERGPRPIEGFTAAATLIDLENPESARRETARQKKRPLRWQRDAWTHYDEVPEVRAFGRWMGDAQSRVRIYPEVLPTDPDQAAVPASQADDVLPQEVEIANACIDRLSSEDGDRSEMQRMLGVNHAIAGEAWIVGTEENDDFRTPDNPTGEQWKVYSVEELCIRDDRWAIQPYLGAGYDELQFLDPATTTLIRSYRRHGRWHEWPDSPMRSANIIAEEILLATQHILGSLRSRLPAGILPIPDDLEDDADEDDATEDANDDVDPLLRKLAKHLSMPITDPRSAAALTPFLMRVPPDLIDKLKLIDLSKAIDPEAIKRLDQLVKRLAIAVDMPPEALTGMSGMNHWSAWLVGEDAVRNHIEPYTGLYTMGLTTKYLRPRLEAAGVREPWRWQIGYDASECIAHPDKKQNALDGWDRILVSDHTAVQALGFSDENMPDEAERARRIEERLAGGGTGPVDGSTTVKSTPPVDSSPAVTASLYDIGARYGLSAREVERLTPEEFIDLVRSDDNERMLLQASATPREPIGRRWGRIEAQLARDLLVDADSALRRVLERAQARIRTAARTAPLGPTEQDKLLGTAIRAQSRALNPAELAVSLGAEQVHALGLSDDDLFAGGLGSLEDHFMSWTEGARAKALAELRRLGINPSDEHTGTWDAQATHNGVDGWALLSTGLTTLASGLLFSPTGPETQAPTRGEWDATLAASPRLIRDALTAAGGGPPEGAEIGGMLGGADFLAFLESVPEFDVAGWVWTVGAPDRPFEPHQNLDGTEFAGWEDDQLSNDEGWPDYTSYFPGDHEGCECEAVPTGTASVTLPEEGD